MPKMDLLHALCKPEVPKYHSNVRNEACIEMVIEFIENHDKSFNQKILISQEIFIKIFAWELNFVWKDKKYKN